jgi:hypothetical protein
MPLSPGLAWPLMILSMIYPASIGFLSRAARS